MIDDTELLRRFATENSEAAFRELVVGRIDFVYAAALRQVGGDTHLAQEVAQGVFLDLARKARPLASRPNLTGWLYTSTRFAAAKALRSRARRLNHETEAHAMNEILSAPAASSANEADWNELRPVIDAVMHELPEPDREALLLRFFEERSLAEVGAAIGLEENSARMRVERALEKLRSRLARRGVTSTAAALGVALANQPVVLAPAGLAGAIIADWPAVVGAGGEIFSIMNTLKLITGMAAAGAVGIGGTYGMMRAQQETRLAAIEAQANSTAAALLADNARLQRELARSQTALTAAQSEAASPLADLRALVRSAQQKVIAPMTSLLKMTNGQLQPAVAKLFNLSPEEKTSVEKTLGETRRDVDTLAAANVQDVERATPDRVVIRFKLAPEAGGKVYDQTVAALTQTLGAERQAAVMALMGEQFEVIGLGFGARERTLMIDRLQVGTTDRPLFFYTALDRVVLRTATRVLPSGTQTMPSTVVSLPTSGDRVMIQRSFPDLGKLLPTDF